MHVSTIPYAPASIFSSDFLTHCPSDLMVNILSYLSLSEQVVFRLGSRHWQEISERAICIHVLQCFTHLFRELKEQIKSEEGFNQIIDIEKELMQHIQVKESAQVFQTFTEKNELTIEESLSLIKTYRKTETQLILILKSLNSETELCFIKLHFRPNHLRVANIIKLAKFLSKPFVDYSEQIKQDIQTNQLIDARALLSCIENRNSYEKALLDLMIGYLNQGLSKKFELLIPQLTILQYKQEALTRLCDMYLQRKDPAQVKQLIPSLSELDQSFIQYRLCQYYLITEELDEVEKIMYSIKASYEQSCILIALIEFYINEQFNLEKVRSYISYCTSWSHVNEMFKLIYKSFLQKHKYEIALDFSLLFDGESKKYNLIAKSLLCQALLEHREWKKVEIYLSSHLDAQSEEGQAIVFALGMAYLKEGMIEQAERLCLSIFDSQFEVEKPLYKKLLTEEVSILQVQRGELDKAIELFYYNAELEKSRLPKYLFQACIQQSRLKEAEEFLSFIKNDEHQNYRNEPIRNLCQAYIACNQQDNVQRFIESLVGILERNQALDVLGLAYLEQKEIEKVEKIVFALIEDQTDAFYRTLEALSHFYLKEGRLEEAEKTTWLIANPIKKAACLRSIGKAYCEEEELGRMVHLYHSIPNEKPYYDTKERYLYFLSKVYIKKEAFIEAEMFALSLIGSTSIGEPYKDKALAYLCKICTKQKCFFKYYKRFISLITHSRSKDFALRYVCKAYFEYQKPERVKDLAYLIEDKKDKYSILKQLGDLYFEQNLLDEVEAIVLLLPYIGYESSLVNQLCFHYENTIQTEKLEKLIFNLRDVEYKEQALKFLCFTFIKKKLLEEAHQIAESIQSPIYRCQSMQALSLAYLDKEYMETAEKIAFSIINPHPHRDYKGESLKSICLYHINHKNLEKAKELLLYIQDNRIREDIQKELNRK